MKKKLNIAIQMDPLENLDLKGFSVGWEPLSEKHLFETEYWELQRKKLVSNLKSKGCSFETFFILICQSLQILRPSILIQLEHLLTYDP